MRKQILFTTIALAMVSLPLFADTIAVLPQGGHTATDGRAFMIGWEFTVSTPIMITGLAYRDTTGTGLVDSHHVGIFDGGTGGLLVDATVDSGGAPAFLNGFRVAPVSCLLNPGDYVIGGQTLSANDSALGVASSVIEIPGVSYVQERELNTALFIAPTVNVYGAEKGIFGPDFVGSVVPEPTSFLLLGTGLGALGLAAWRRKRA